MARLLLRQALRLARLLDRAQALLARVQLALGLAEGLFLLLRLGAERAPAQGQQLGLQFAFLLLVFLELFRIGGLPLEGLQPLHQLAAQVIQAVEVLARVLDAGFGLAAPLLVLGDAGGLFQDQAQLVGLGLDEARHGALLDDGVVVAASHAGAQEQVDDVAAAAARAVEEIAGVAVARQLALDRDLAEAAIAVAEAALAVVEQDLDRGAAHGFPVARAVEDHVLALRAAQLLGAHLAQHPAHGVDDVGLAAAVGADHAGQVAVHVQHGRVHEGLEAGQLDGGQTHSKNTARCLDETDGSPVYPRPCWGKLLTVFMDSPPDCTCRASRASNWKPSATRSRGATIPSACASPSSVACAPRPASRTSPRSTSSTCRTGPAWS
jgi:hypothetical protein